LGAGSHTLEHLLNLISLVPAPNLRIDAKNKLHVRQRRVESTAATRTPQEPQQLAGELLRWRLLQGTAAAMQVDTSQLEVVIEVVIRKVRCKKQLFVVTCVGFA